VPNWCSNIVEISSNSTADLDAVMALIGNTDEPFNAIFPRAPDEDWYDWSIANWGTKWDASDFSISRDSDDHITLTFDTAWSPSLGVTGRLADRFPSLEIRHFYEEPGMAFNGCAVFADGAMGSDECRDMGENDMPETEDGEENPNYVPLTERF
jgi:hypothetical protein